MHLLMLILTLNISTHAEYRAYQLRLKNLTTGNEKILVSTLDHIQYRTYYPVRADEVVEYVSSWRCHGSTAYHKVICPHTAQDQEPETAQPKPNLPSAQ